MAINYSTEFQSKTADALTVASLIAGKTSNAYSWDGSKSIEVATIQTVPFQNYTRSGVNRYGTPTEIEDTKQVLTVEQDKGYSLTVDKGRMTEQKRIVNGAKVHGLQAKEQGVPMVDTYALKVFAENAGSVSVDGALTSSTALDKIFAADIAMRNAKVPMGADKYLFIKASTYGLVRADSRFITVEALGKKVLETGVLGMIADFKVVVCPDDYFDENTNFLAFYKKAVLAPIKIQDAKIHLDPPGISGDLVEGRTLFDAFVLDTYKKAVYVSLVEARSE